MLVAGAEILPSAPLLTGTSAERASVEGKMRGSSSVGQRHNIMQVCSCFLRERKRESEERGEREREREREREEREERERERKRERARERDVVGALTGAKLIATCKVTIECRIIFGQCTVKPETTIIQIRAVSYHMVVAAVRHNEGRMDNAPVAWLCLRECTLLRNVRAQMRAHVHARWCAALCVCG